MKRRDDEIHERSRGLKTISWKTGAYKSEQGKSSNLGKLTLNWGGSCRAMGSKRTGRGLHEGMREVE